MYNQQSTAAAGKFTHKVTTTATTAGTAAAISAGSKSDRRAKSSRKSMMKKSKMMMVGSMNRLHVRVVMHSNQYCFCLANSMGLATAYNNNVNGHNAGGQEQQEEEIRHSGAKYINVDMSRPAGIQHAQDLQLLSTPQHADMVHVISAPYLFETGLHIFSDMPNISGKCFTLLRHPVDRAISSYHHHQSSNYCK